MSMLATLLKTAQTLLADGRVKDAIALLRREIRPELEFQQELDAYAHNTGVAATQFAQQAISFDEKMRADALAVNGIQLLLSRLREDDLVYHKSQDFTDAERAGQQRLLHLATEKRNRLQTAHLLETDEARRFAYEKQIDELDAQIAALQSQIPPKP